jgi:hypothetical protein
MTTKFQNIDIPSSHQKCPIPHQEILQTLNIVKRVVLRVVWKSRVLDDKKEEEYSQYALLIQDFYKKYGENLDTRYNTLFTKELSRDEYCMKIHAHITSLLWSLANETYNLRYGTLDSWIGTMILILSGIFHHVPHITEAECISYCEDIMKNIPIEDLPKVQSQKKEAYQNFIGTYLNNRRSWEKKKMQNKLFCPVKYTPEWNKFVREIISAIFRHFPENQNTPLA